MPEVDEVSSVNEQNNIIPLKAISSELLKVYIEGARFFVFAELCWCLRMYQNESMFATQLPVYHA